MAPQMPFKIRMAAEDMIDLYGEHAAQLIADRIVARVRTDTDPENLGELLSAVMKLQAERRRSYQ